MRVALVGPVHPFRGGIAHYTTVLNSELRRKGHDVLLVSFRRQYPRWLFPGRTDRDPSAAVLPAPGALYILDPLNPLTWLKAARTIRAFHPDNLLLQWWQVFWAPVWIVLSLAQAVRRTPVTIICHNVLPHERHWWDRFVTLAVLSFATRAIVGSTAEREELRMLLPHTWAEIVPHPLYDMLATEIISREDARKRLGLAGAPVLLFFGFVREYKGLGYLIEALPEMLRECPALQLIVAGEFWNNRRQYEEQISALGVTRHVMLVDRYIPNEEVGLFFAAADLVTLPYVAATQSGVLQLALGFDRPVVTTRVGGLADGIEEGCDVTLVEPANAHALAQAIMGFLNTPRSAQGRSRELSKERWEILVNAVTRVGQ